STVLSMFLDQFVTLAETGVVPSDRLAHVTNLGLVFRGSPDALANLASVHVVKADMDGQAADARGSIEVLNPRKSWYSYADPILQKTKDPAIDAGGVKLDWRLLMPWTTPSNHDSGKDPEHYLHYYEINCELNGIGRWNEPKRIKPTATLGAPAINLNEDG